MGMWLPREIRLACACGCGQTSDEQADGTRHGRGWGSERVVEISGDEGPSDGVEGVEERQGEEGCAVGGWRDGVAAG